MHDIDLGRRLFRPWLISGEDGQGPASVSIVTKHLSQLPNKLYPGLVIGFCHLTTCALLVFQAFSP